MRVGLFVQGSRGDVQPFVVLARALLARGHEVELAVPPDYVAFSERAGVAARGYGLDTTVFVESPAGRAVLSRGDLVTFARHARANVRAMWDAGMDFTVDTVSRLDVAVANGLTVGQVALATEARPIPWAIHAPFPAVLGSEHASPLVRGRPFAWRWLNRFSHHFAEWILWRDFAALAPKWRKKAGLRAPAVEAPVRMRRGEITGLCGWDEALFPLPPEAPRSCVVTGDWSPPDSIGDPMEPALDAWLADGPPPLYIGFGSMLLLDPPASMQIFERVTAALGLRALIVASATSGLTSSAPHVRIERSVNHRTVLPRCVAAVHHGGAGTTHASTRAGIPTVICPVLLDQFFWAWRVEALGVGASSRLTELTEARFRAALEVALAPETRARARDLATRMRADGIERAADAVLALIQS